MENKPPAAVAEPQPVHEAAMSSARPLGSLAETASLQSNLLHRQRSQHQPSSTGPAATPRKRPRRSFADWYAETDIFAALYYTSLVLLIICLIAFIVATPVDTVIQSQSTGQFWNAIIIVVAYVLTVLIALAIYIVRIVSTRRSLNNIPHAYYIAQVASIPRACVVVIQQELARCADLARRVEPPRGLVSHAGMMPPTISEGGRLVDTPYADVIAVSSAMIESKATVFHPSFGRPTGMPLREYLAFLQGYQLLTDDALVADFVEKYEYARFGGRLLNELEFDQYMEVCRKVLTNMQIPAGGPDMGYTRESLSSAGFNLFDDDQPSFNDPSNRHSPESRRGVMMASSIQWNPAYMHAPHHKGSTSHRDSTDQSAFVDQMAQLSRMTTASSRGNGSVYNLPGYAATFSRTGLPSTPANGSFSAIPGDPQYLPQQQRRPSYAAPAPAPAPAAANQHPTSLSSLSRADSTSSVLRYTSSRPPPSGGARPSFSLPTSRYPAASHSNEHSGGMSRVTSRTSSHRFLARIRNTGHQVLHRTATYESYDSGGGGERPGDVGSLTGAYSSSSGSQASVIIRPVS